jgi:hypothetical protein
VEGRFIAYPCVAACYKGDLESVRRRRGSTLPVRSGMSFASNVLFFPKNMSRT